MDFVDTLNLNDFHIRLTSHVSHDKVEFLDLKVQICKEKITTRLHRKCTATNSLLHFQSFHPEHLRRGIPKGQFLRVRRNCTNDSDFKEEADDLTRRFQARGYPRKTISKAYITAKNTPRKDLLTPKPRKTNTEVRVITRFNNQWDELRGVYNKNWHILTVDPKIALYIADKPNLVARRAPNLRDKLSRSHFSRQTQKKATHVGTYPCGRCNICEFMLSDKTFIHPETQEVQSLKHFINCRTSNVIYGIICPCQKIYVGQTSQELRKRIQQHFSNISLARRDRQQNKTLTTVASHYLMHHGGKYNNSKIVGLDWIRATIRGGDLTPALLRSESRWIYQLNSVAPKGLNEDVLFTGFYKK